MCAHTVSLSLSTPDPAARSQLNAVRSFAADAAAAADTAEGVIQGVGAASSTGDGGGDSPVSGDDSLEAELARTESQNRLNCLKLAGRRAAPPPLDRSVQTAGDLVVRRRQMIWSYGLAKKKSERSKFLGHVFTHTQRFPRPVLQCSENYPYQLLVPSCDRSV